MAMDIDGDEEGVQRPHQVESYGIEADFEILDAEDREASLSIALLLTPPPLMTWLQDGSSKRGANLDAGIEKIISDIEHMAPNMKAMAR